MKDIATSLDFQRVTVKELANIYSVSYPTAIKLKKTILSELHIKRPFLIKLDIFRFENIYN